MSIFNRHTAYERLVTEHVDGQLDEAGEAKLRRHLTTCASCAVEVREQQAVRALLVAQPMVAAPRSFALPYAPRQAAIEDSRSSRWLRSMQVATATAAIVLVALVGINVVDPTGDVRGTDADAAALSAVIEKADAGAPEAARTPSDGLSLSAPSRFASEGLVPESGLAVEDELAPADEAPSPAAPPTELLFAPGLGAPDVAGDDRSALEWALLAAGAITAVLALSVVAVTWRARRPV